jgi:xanthine dehydrogenase accessory factor
LPEEILARAAELQRRGQPFALATVVRSERPTSAKPGAKALVLEDGSVTGWIGGACAEPVVVREALAALRDGRPRLIGLIGEGGRGPGRTEGIMEFPMTCHSGGTLEIYVEPYLPRHQLVLVGHGPVAEALATLGEAAGYSIVTVAGGAELAGLDLGHRTAVVVATHADADEDALARVLATEVGYVSLVASRRRAGAIVESLRAGGIAPERLGALKAPAGLDIGAVTPEEIAVSILAEIVQHHRSDKSVHAGTAVVREEAVDPICGMTVEIATARYRSEVAGEIVYFCCRRCQETFEGAR